MKIINPPIKDRKHSMKYNYNVVAPHRVFQSSNMHVLYRRIYDNITLRKLYEYRVIGVYLIVDVLKERYV